MYRDVWKVALRRTRSSALDIALRAKKKRAAWLPGFLFGPGEETKFPARRLSPHRGGELADLRSSFHQKSDLGNREVFTGSNVWVLWGESL